MIYQKALRQINTVFPKLSIKPPVKKVSVRPLIQQIQCPQFSNNDFSLLKNQETSAIALSKLSNLISVWIKVVQQNQKARQQYQSKPPNFKEIQKMEYLFAECQQLSSKSQFVFFIKQRAQVFSNWSATATVSHRNYKQIYICKQLQFYNTITKIRQQEYFKIVEQLNERLGVMQQLIRSTAQNPAYLQQFQNMLQKDELFVKKDNSINRVIAYNLVKAVELQQKIENAKKLIYHYEDMLVFSLTRCYFLIYRCRKQIQQNQNNEQHLEEIQKFICQRPQRVFVKLYNRKISKSLIELEKIREKFIKQKYNKIQSFQEVQAGVKNGMIALEQKIKVNMSDVAKQMSEQLFLQIFNQIQNLIVQINKLVNTSLSKEELIRYKSKLIRYQTQTIKHFIRQDNAFLNENNPQRKVLSIENSRLSVRSRQSDVKMNSKNNQNIIKRNTFKGDNQIGHNLQIADKGEDIFIYARHGSITQEKIKEKIQYYTSNKQQYYKSCQKYIQNINPSFGECLEDSSNFNPEQLNLLIESGNMIQLAVNEKQVLMLLNRSLIRPEISEQTLGGIFRPKLRFTVLRTLSDKLIELGYRSTKTMDNPEFQNLPQNIKNFVVNRSLFLKTVNKQIEKIIDIAALISGLNISQKFDACEYRTWDTFLKVLLAQKQVRAYQLAFRDEKNTPKAASFFIQNKIYVPLIQTITSLLPPPYNNPKEIVDVLEHLQFFSDLRKQTEQIISTHLRSLQEQKDKTNIQLICRELSKQLKKWYEEGSERVKSKRPGIVYTQAQRQIWAIKQIIDGCNNEQKLQISQQRAKRILTIINSK